VAAWAYAIDAFKNIDIIDNTVAGVYTDSEASFVVGIELSADGHEARGNLVRGLAPGSGLAVAMQANAFGASFTGNRVSAEVSGTAGVGIWANGGFCIGNTVRNYEIPYNICHAGADNLSLPVN
jgi:hypothetical protein